MEKNSVGGKFQWPKIWMVPLGITFAGAIVLAVLFKVPDPAEFKKDVPAPHTQAVVIESGTPAARLIHGDRCRLLGGGEASARAMCRRAEHERRAVKFVRLQLFLSVRIG